MRERLKRIFILFMAAAVLLGAAPSTAFTALADEKETENEDLEIPKVFHKDDDNEVVRIVIGKTPSITIGKSSTISIAVKNTTDTDWLESEIWIAPEADYQGYYDEIEDEDGEIIKTMNATYPFEITDSLNKHYKIGHINAGAKKTVNLRVNVKKNLKEGYYPVKLYISKRSRGEDGMSGEFQKTVMVWAETKEASSTSESDESSTEPIGFALGENQSTPQANYNEVMNFI